MGIPLMVLLDKREEPLLPVDIANFYIDSYTQGKVWHHYESEVIWHAVGQSTWLELDSYLQAVEQRVREHVNEWKRDFSVNLLSERVRKQWAQLCRAWQASQNDSWRLITDTGFLMFMCIVGMHLMRQDFIQSFNALHPDLSPPLQEADDLNQRLVPYYEGLPTFQPHRVMFFLNEGRPYTTPGHLTTEEINYLRTRGIHFGLRADSSSGFDNTVDTRISLPPPLSSDLLGMPEFIEKSIARARRPEREGEWITLGGELGRKTVTACGMPWWRGRVYSKRRLFPRLCK
ncbi:BZ3500_MvSof-1268-A1-R1_Chr6-3g09017 [Microbotryum saponariae]|uniref:BZ3500_MvSof-1268-A1-R1_Chr6-3g09017 protein n=1 Tax=Microbotryum saponariae TaxID=289078 RepID=A0A2X0MI18_9BASI|nr:BZ3500_MvSof-1268-A1-R1_Chr6-3g09017 [Microbotryum saponariae]SDA07619.1 BZ3501_MvSof-1269-A2-R1_Chr6-2g08721 [Microbotryum saponariae]